MLPRIAAFAGLVLGLSGVASAAMTLPLSQTRSISVGSQSQSASGYAPFNASLLGPNSVSKADQNSTIGDTQIFCSTGGETRPLTGGQNVAANFSYTFQ